MTKQDLAERLKLVLRIGGAGRVVRAVQDEEPGSRCDCRLELRGGDLVAIFGTAIWKDRHAVRQQDHVRVGHPVRSRNDGFIAGVHHRHDHVVNGLLRAGGDQYLGSRVVESVVAAKLGCDRVLQLRRSFDRRVTRKAAANRGDARVRNVRRRIEVRLADAQPDDVAPLRAQADDPPVQGDCRRGLYALDALRKDDGHGWGFPERSVAVILDDSHERHRPTLSTAGRLPAGG